MTRPPQRAETEMAGLKWRKSSYSNDAGECVETALLADHRVAVRHSKRPDGAVLIFTPAEWRAFIAGAKSSEFDAP